MSHLVERVHQSKTSADKARGQGPRHRKLNSADLCSPRHQARNCSPQSGWIILLSARCLRAPVTGWCWKSPTRPNSWQAQISKQKVATGGVSTDEHKEEDRAQLSKPLSGQKTLENLATADFWQWRKITCGNKARDCSFFEGLLTHSVCVDFARLCSSHHPTRSHQPSCWRTESAGSRKVGGRANETWELKKFLALATMDSFH